MSICDTGLHCGENDKSDDDCFHCSLPISTRVFTHKQVTIMALSQIAAHLPVESLQDRTNTQEFVLSSPI